MFQILVTYREHGIQQRRQFNADKLATALETAHRELARPATRSVELTMTVEVWLKQQGGTHVTTTR